MKRYPRCKAVTLALAFLCTCVSIAPATVDAAVIDCSTVKEIPVAECNALVDLYKYTGGGNTPSSWTVSTGWNQTDTPCSWYGVTCVDTTTNKSVSELKLASNGLNGPLPASLGDLTKLTNLSLSSNQLTGSIPPELGNLTRLIKLYLSNNQLTGTIPAELGNLSSLIALYCDFNQLTGSIPAKLGSLSSLNYLTLAQNQLSGRIPPELGSLSSLIGFSLYGNQLCGAIPSSLQNLTNLTDGTGLNIRQNYLFTDDAALDAFLILKGGDWESSQGEMVCPSLFSWNLVLPAILNKK